MADQNVGQQPIPETELKFLLRVNLRRTSCQVILHNLEKV
jgi:hypothetical protein